MTVILASHSVKSIQGNSGDSNIIITELVASDPIIINDDAGLKSFASAGTGTSEDPYIISNHEIIVSDGEHGIRIDGTTKYFEIRDNYVSTGNLQNVFGIYVMNVESNTATISNNQLENNMVGIIVDASPYTKISNNNISNSNKYGIEILDASTNSRIELNNIYSVLESGIRIDSRGSSVILNQVINIFDNDETPPSFGIQILEDDAIVQNNGIEGYWEGINLSPVSNAQIIANNIDSCESGITGWPSNSLIAYNIVRNGYMSGNGIRLQGEFDNYNSDNNIISYNTIENYPSFGLQLLENSNNNLVANNSFIDNSYEIDESQSNDEASGNIIDHNYWDDWISPDENEDGIVDNPYAISGSSKNADNQPLVLNIIVNQLAETDERYKPLAFLEPLNNPWIIVPSILALISIPLISFIRNIPNAKLVKLTSRTLTEIIGFAPVTLMAIFSKDAEANEEIQELIPSELNNHKFLLNPIRLSIIKMLHTHYSYPAYMLRESLQISWGKFSSHVSALIEKGYISSVEEFYEGSPKRILRIELFGENSYMELREILLHIFDVAA